MLVPQSVLHWATMRMILALATLTLCHSFWFNSKFNISGSLQEGSSYASVNGEYLRDDFRVSVLIPSLKTMRESIKANRERDLLVDLVLFIVITGLMTALLGVFLFFNNKINGMLKSDRYN